MRIADSLAKLLVCLALVECGCQSLPWQNQWAKSSADEEGMGLEEPKHRHRLGDAPSWNKDVEDPYGYVGQAAREARPVEKEPDPWYRNWLMSPEARNIERSLGIVDE